VVERNVYDCVTATYENLCYWRV